LSRAHELIQDLKRRKSITNMRLRQKIVSHIVLENFTLFIITIINVLGVKEERNILNRINRRKANLIYHI
jgi:hypothetical protein